MRVIAGTLRGRTLRAPPGDETRPTLDRVRESLFSILGDCSGCRVADLFAGTGSLGIEALSRQAAFATFVESAPTALRCLKQNLTTLGLTSRSEVLETALERSFKELASIGPFDLIFCDPPWAQMERVLRWLQRGPCSEWLSPEGSLILEHAASFDGLSQSLGGDLVAVDSRRWGDSAITIYCHPDSAEP